MITLFYVYGLIESYQSTFNTDYLSLAIKLTRDMIELLRMLKREVITYTEKMLKP